MIARMTRRETPTKHKGKWSARWTDNKGQRRYGWLKPHGIKGTYALKRDAQAAIDRCHELDNEGAAVPATVGTYAETWLTHHPRSRVSNNTNRYRLNAVLDVRLEGSPLRDWPFDQLRRRHANFLVDHLFSVQGRAHTGVVNVMGVLSAMAEDAMDDEVAVGNPFKGVKIRRNDPRIQKGTTPVRVFSWPEMHALARACAMAESGPAHFMEWRAVFAEPMVRVLSDCGLRAGELLALERTDLDLKAGTLRVKQTASLGEILQGTKTDHGQPDAGRTVPVPPELLGMLRGMLEEAMKLKSFWASPLLLPNPHGGLWLYSTWWMRIWGPGRELAGMDIRPHEMRHSWVSLLRAQGIDAADLADASGHSVEMASKRYTHGLGRSAEAIRKAVGE